MIKNCDTHICCKCQRMFEDAVNESATIEIQPIDWYAHTNMGRSTEIVYLPAGTVIIGTGYDSQFDEIFFRFLVDGVFDTNASLSYVEKHQPWIKGCIDKGICDGCIIELIKNRVIELAYTQNGQCSEQSYCDMCEKYYSNGEVQALHYLTDDLDLKTLYYKYVFSPSATGLFRRFMGRVCSDCIKSSGLFTESPFTEEME